MVLSGAACEYVKCRINDLFPRGDFCYTPFESHFRANAGERHTVRRERHGSKREALHRLLQWRLRQRRGGLTLATGAAATNRKVTIFFTFWGLNIIKKRHGHRWNGRGFMARFFNFLLGGRNNLPLSRLNFGGLSPKLMTGMMKAKNVATLENF